MMQKRLRFVFDLSQSMSRGNGWDKRLDRTAQTAALLMESLSGFEHKFHYSMYGQSGSSACVPLWDPEVAPQPRMSLHGTQSDVSCTKFKSRVVLRVCCIMQGIHSVLLP